MSVVSWQASRHTLKFDFDSPASCNQTIREMINKYIALYITAFIIFQSHYVLAMLCVERQKNIKNKLLQ
jgi:hypothetical protein